MARLSSRVVHYLIVLLLSCSVIIVSGSQVSSLQVLATADNDYSCSKDKPCTLGCCGPLDATGKGVCGLGPDFCGKGCTSDCDRKSECDPGWGKEWSNASTCPLKVCCSKFGFCGKYKTLMRLIYFELLLTIYPLQVPLRISAATRKSSLLNATATVLPRESSVTGKHGTLSDPVDVRISHDILTMVVKSN